MLETQMSRQGVFQEARSITNYLRKHCLSWYTFASDKELLVEFGDIMLVTECSKTAAWALAVYSQNSRDFKLSFTVGGVFTNELVSSGFEGIDAVSVRRSHRRLIAPADVDGAPKDQTVFIKGYRPGPRSLYLRSFAQKIRALSNQSPDAKSGGGPAISNPLSSSNLGSLRLMNEGDDVTPLSFVCPVSIREVEHTCTDAPPVQDFHPATALLAHRIEVSHSMHRTCAYIGDHPDNQY
jgi:hypothetical protein